MRAGSVFLILPRPQAVEDTALAPLLRENFQYQVRNKQNMKDKHLHMYIGTCTDELVQT